MVAAEGILTQRGGMTSHAAVVARGMGKCCVAGCSQISVDEDEKKVTIDGKVYGEGDYISLDGTSGKVYSGEIEAVDPRKAALDSYRGSSQSAFGVQRIFRRQVFFQNQCVSGGKRREINRLGFKEGLIWQRH